MKILRYSTQYKKDFKKYRHWPEKPHKLLKVFKMLENEEKTPPVISRQGRVMKKKQLILMN